MKNNNQDLPHGSGMIYNMVGWLGSNKTTVYFITFLLFLAGSYIYTGLPKELYPEIKVPQIYVQTAYFGTTPADIENVINKPIEKQLKTIAGVKSIKSNALQDISVILVEFNPNVKTEVALQGVRDAIDKAKRDLPTKLDSGPTAQDVNFSEFPIMNVNLAGNFPLAKLKDYAEQLQDEIESIPQITRVDIVGALKREIQINLDLSRMKSSGLTFFDVQSAVQSENINISGGELNVNGVRRTIRVKGEFKGVDQIKNIIIRSGSGAVVRLSDVAEVVDSNEDRQDFARLDGKSVVTLNVIKRGGANLVAASDKIELIIESFKEKLPQGVKIQITADSSERTKENVDDLVNTVILGFIFVVLVLMFFMGVRDAFFVGLSVPLSALLAFIPLYYSGFTLNTMVLFSFLLGLGIVVDDAIVVIENSHRIFNKFRDLTIMESVKLAASEVFLPVLSGTLTTIAPFVPLLFWPGIVGSFMIFLPITLIYTLFASLIVAYVINPVFAMSFMKRHDEELAEQKNVGNLRSLRRPLIIMITLAIVGYLINFGIGNFIVMMLVFYLFNHFILTPRIIIPFQERVIPAFKAKYRAIVSWLITRSRPVWAIVSMFFLLIGTFVLMGIVKPKAIFFPSGDPDYIYAYHVMPVGTDPKTTDSVTKILEAKIISIIKANKAEKAVNSIISNVGKNAGNPFNPDRSATPQKSKITVAFVKNSERGNINTAVILDKVREGLVSLKLPGSELSIERENNGPQTGKPIAIEIAGSDFKVLQKLEKDVLAKIASSGIKGIDYLKGDLITNKPEIIVEIDKEKAQREGISSSQVALAIRTALFGSEISKFRDDKDEYPIQLRVKSDDRDQVEKLLAMNITYRDMVMGGVLRDVPLSTIAKISYGTTFSQINRKNQERVISLSSDVVTGYNPNEIVGQIQKLITEIEVPSGYIVRMGGEQEAQTETINFLLVAFLGAVLLIFLILTIQFNSLSKPIIIFATIVFALIGVFLGFMAFDMTFSFVMTGVGIFALAGIVIKNGILIIEFTDELRARGYDLKEAIIEAGSVRLTPVLLTAFAAILGLLPLAVGMSINFVTIFTEFNPQIAFGGDSATFWGILAWTIIFGLSFSTILTLLIVPCMYYLNERFRARFRTKKVVENVELALEEV